MNLSRELQRFGFLLKYNVVFRESAGVGEPGQTVNLLSMTESVRITPLPFCKYVWQGGGVGLTHKIANLAYSIMEYRGVVAHPCRLYMAAYRNGYNGADLKSAVWACIPPGRSNRSAVVSSKPKGFLRNTCIGFLFLSARRR